MVHLVMSARKTNLTGSFQLCFAMYVCRVEGAGRGGLMGEAEQLWYRKVLSSEKQVQKVSSRYDMV